MTDPSPATPVPLEVGLHADKPVDATGVPKR